MEHHLVEPNFIKKKKVYSENCSYQNEIFQTTPYTEYPSEMFLYQATPFQFSITFSFERTN